MVLEAVLMLLLAGLAVLLGFYLLWATSVRAATFYLPGPPGIVIITPELNPDTVRVFYPGWRQVMVGVRDPCRKGSVSVAAVPFVPNHEQAEYLFSTIAPCLTSSAAWQFVRLALR